MQDDNVSYLKAFFRNKWVRIVLILDVIAIAVVIGVYVRQATKISTISFNIAPVDATISVNGDSSYKNGRYSITPGTYEVKISHKDLETKTMKINIESRHYVAVTTFLAGADNNFDFYAQRNRSSSYQKLKDIASKDNNITTDSDTSAQDFIENFEHILSITDKLPIKGYVYADPNASSSTGGFAIRDGQSNKKCEKAACLLVKYYGKDYEEEVKKQIKEAGYNPDDYQLIYERYS